MRIPWISMAGLAAAGLAWTLASPRIGTLTAQQSPASTPQTTAAGDLEALCGDCHVKSLRAYGQTLHGKLFRESPRGDSERANCESCHGSLRAHAEDPGNPELITSLQRARQPDARKRSAPCLSCHQNGAQFDASHGRHLKAGVACGDCHLVMRPASEQKLLKAPDANELCRSCHAGIAMQSGARTTHISKTGGMNCVDCHNPHSAERSILKHDTVNETCATCHKPQSGPFLFEHAPAANNCMSCHAPHGATQPALLKMNVDALCMSCHSQTPWFHVQAGINRFTLSRGCANCHPMVHGSNHATGNRLLR